MIGLTFPRYVCIPPPLRETKRQGSSWHRAAHALLQLDLPNSFPVHSFSLLIATYLCCAILAAMTDYNKLTVANLRALLKDRSIPSTGLTRKAQIIEKLEEADREAGAQDAAQVAPQNDEAVVDTQANLESEDKAEKKDGAPPEAAVTSAAQDATESKEAHEEQPASTDTQATIQPSEEAAAPVTAESSMTMPTNDAPMPPPPTSTQETTTQPALPTSESQPPEVPEAPPESQDLPPPSHEPSVAPSVDSILPEELAEDRKKRKRRSPTPSVIEDEIVNKKLRQDDEDGTVHL